MGEILTSRVGIVRQPFKAELFTRDVPAPAKGQVVVKIKSSAVCGSDVHIFKGKHPKAPLPVTIGHEFSGDVAALGEGCVISPGTRVTVEPCIVCGSCDACRRGNYGYCERISFTYRRGDGAMADYITVDEAHVFPLPEDIGYDAGALIEPLAVAVHAVRRADVRIGETVLIVGAGAIGILIAAVCRHAGAQKVIVSDLVEKRLNLALEFGATHAINSAVEDFDAAVGRLADGGVDKSFECVGLEISLRQAINCLRRSGTATVVGIFEKPEVNLDAGRFVSHEIRVQGAQGYCWDFPAAVSLAGQIGLERLVTHTFALDDLQKAMDICLDRDAGAVKVIIRP